MRPLRRESFQLQDEGKDMLSKLSLEEATKMESDLEGGETSFELDGKKVTLSQDMITAKKYQKTFHVEEIIPSVIEPSFGDGRVMYAIFEHNFKLKVNNFSVTPKIFYFKGTL